MDALGLPLRIMPTPGQWGDAPQAAALVSGLAGIAHVVADAAYDADHFRDLIRDGLGAEAQIPSNPLRTRACPLDRALYAERRLIENFFNRLKRFRRIALRCERPSRRSWVSFISPAPSTGSGECRHHLVPRPDPTSEFESFGSGNGSGHPAAP